MPSGSQLLITIIFGILTMLFSNVDFFKNFIYVPDNFNLLTAMLDSLDSLIEALVGDQIARSGVVAIFWALTGLLVYILIWLTLNFSNELGNDLATTKYVHPKNVDTRSPLRDLVSKISFQAMSLALLVFYINFLLTVLLPYVGDMFRNTIDQWPSLESFKYLCLGMITELITLHVFVILVRALTLRKRIFG